MWRTFLLALGTILLCLILGCGGSADVEFTGRLDPETADEDLGNQSGLNLTSEGPSVVAEDEPNDGPGKASKLQRKIIYHATLDIVVESFAGVSAEIRELVQQYDGFIAKSSIDTATGRPRSGSWTLRVPAVRYRGFLEAAGSLGELQKRTEDSREVTAEYFDLETRIRNKQQQETRLLEHLEQDTGKLEDILAVEKELGRVRTDIEQMQGQLRLLKDLTSLSTVTVNVSELRHFVPAENPTFATQIRRAWTKSVSSLATVTRNAVIAVVALVPWLVILLPLVVIWALYRRWRPRRRNSP